MFYLLGFVFYSDIGVRKGISEDANSTEDQMSLTKQEILEGLSASKGGDTAEKEPLDAEEKKKILESLSADAPSGQSMSSEEKKAILESLSAPQ